MTGAHDVIVVGSGINSLACAALLAKAGKRVLVLERNDYVGGAIRTAEITEPGFVHEVFAAWHPLFVGSGAYAELKDDLHARGLEYLNTDLPTASVFPDGSSIFLTTSHATNVAEWEGHAAGDGEAWDRVVRPSCRTRTSPSACSAPSSGPRTASGSRCGHTGGSGAGGRSSSPGTCCRRAATGRPTRLRRTACTGCSRRGCCMPASVPTQPRPVSWPR